MKDYIVACWGSSLTYGEGAHTVDEDNSFPKVVSDLSGLNVYNMGVGGESVITIGSRMGAFDIRTRADFVIPAATTPVPIDFYGYNKDGSEAGMVVPHNVELGGWTPITINGIKGKLSVVLDETVWPNTLKFATFTRLTPGDEILVKAGTQMLPSSYEIAKEADINIICGWANGGWDNENTFATYHKPEALITAYDKMIASMKDPTKYIITNCFSENIDCKDACHKALLQNYGEHIVQVAEFIRSDEAFAYAGIEKTAKDEEYIAQGFVPYSFLNQPEIDKAHMNKYGYKVLGKLVYEKMLALGYTV